MVVVPSYRLVWYNIKVYVWVKLLLLFPVIAWYGIMSTRATGLCKELLFPVIAWYGIIVRGTICSSALLLFPVIAWYGIIE